MADSFIVTQVGLNNSVNAAAHGIQLVLATFKVGSAFGYTPSKNDTALHGTVLYTDNITNYSTDSQGNLVINCTINVTAGPFSFGEVGIYQSDGTLFALMALPALQQKFSSLGTNIASTFTFTCYMRLGQAGGVIQITTGGQQGFQYIGQPNQPTWVWGTNDGGNSYVWNPTNFNVATARGILNTGGATYLAATHTFKNAAGSANLLAIDGSGNAGVAGNLGVTGTITANGNISTSGQFIATGDVVGLSDISVKTNIEQIKDPMAVIRKLTGVTYTRSDTGEESSGLIAQWTEAHWPRVVQDRPDGKKGIAYGNMAGLFVEGMKSLDDRTASTEDQVLGLTERIEELERKLALS